MQCNDWPVLNDDGPGEGENLGMPIINPLFTKILLDLKQISTRLWLISLYFSSIGEGYSHLSPLSSTFMF